MRIGLSFDLKGAVPVPQSGTDDAQEEYDCDETISIIRAALESAGHEVVLLGGGTEFMYKVATCCIDFVFNIAEGRGVYRSREAQVPSVLEMLDIPYSGSDPQCLSICLDKPLTKTLVQAAGVRTPRWAVIKSTSEINALSEAGISFPAIVKPAFEGSSKGVRETSLVRDLAAAQAETLRMLECYRQPVMIEQFISGDEITVGIVGNAPPKVLGVMRVLPRRKDAEFIYSLDVKRNWREMVDYECPAALPDAVTTQIKKSSLAVFDALGCRDFARVDFRISGTGIPHFIEVNPLPGLGSYSDLVIMAQLLGRSHHGLILDVLNAAVKERPQVICA